jgi:hypothetical protein
MGQVIWSDRTMEPKRSFRWLFSFGNASEGLPAYLCKGVNKPGFTIANTDHVFLNHTFYYPGRVEWKEVTVTIADALEPDAAYHLYNMLSQMGYRIPDLTTALPTEELTTISKKKASQDALGQVVIQQIDASGAIREEWTLHNPFVTDVDFGKLSYSEDSIVELTIKFRYDWATEKSIGADGVAREAGR